MVLGIQIYNMNSCLTMDQKDGLTYPLIVRRAAIIPKRKQWNPSQQIFLTDSHLHLQTFAQFPPAPKEGEFLSLPQMSDFFFSPDKFILPLRNAKVSFYENVSTLVQICFTSNLQRTSQTLYLLLPLQPLLSSGSFPLDFKAAQNVLIFGFLFSGPFPSSQAEITLLVFICSTEGPFFGLILSSSYTPHLRVWVQLSLCL